MEHALGVLYDRENAGCDCVLILIVMEHALGGWQ